MAASPKHVAIVGGGIAGLATAHALQSRAAEAGLPLTCTLIEASREWGGKIATHRVNGFIIEAGPDSFLSQKPWALDLCRRLGLSDQLINTKASYEKAFVFSRGRLRPLPDGLVVVMPTRLWPFLRSGVLSFPGMMRMAMDLVIPKQPAVDQDESLASFFRRRLGREAFERLVEPLMAGIYAGDAEQMSLRATFPRFLEMERRYGSLMRGILAGRRAGRSGSRDEATARTTFVTLRDGLSTLTGALVAQLEKAGVKLMAGQRVAALQVRSGHPDGMYALRLEGGVVVSADAVVLATPAYVSASLIRSLNPCAADLLDAILYASTATVSLAYDTESLGGSVKGFGFVVPRVERCDLLAATWTSLKWDHRAPPGHTLVRCYIGGIKREALLMMDDKALIGRVQDELRTIAGVIRKPVYAEVNRWERAMPQYTLGHTERLAELQRLLQLYPGLFLTGAGYRGVGIPDCIRDGTETAEQVIRDIYKC